VPAGRVAASHLRGLVERALRDGALGDDLPRDARVEHVPNWGGFVNASFRLVGRGETVRLKLAHDPDGIADLRRWEGFAPFLEARYAAPRWRRWIRVPGTIYEGAVFDWIPGASPVHRTPDLVARVGDVLDRLHADANFAERLRGRDSPATCRDVFLSILDRRLREDVRLVEPARPAFVSDGDFARMRAEVDGLARAVRESKAFDLPATAACHSDLWIENVVVGDDGRLWILDWDRVDVGDPVFDWATLLGPLRREAAAARVEEAPPRVLADPLARERFEAYARAGLLDVVVDGLADWVDAPALGEGVEAMRREKQASIEGGWEAYRARYAGHLY
jgi:hypothetical protein